MLNIYKYQDYRLYLKDYFYEKKETNTKFSYRIFSKNAGFSSPNFLKLIIQGKRNLSLEGVQKVSKALQLNSKSRQYFERLVRWNQSRNITTKYEITKEIIENDLLLKDSQFEYYKNWFNVPIREATFLLGEFTENEYMSCVQKMFPQLEQKEIQDSLNIFLKLGFVSKGSAGKFQAIQKTIKTGDLFSNVFILYFHKKMMELAIQSLIKFHSEDREIGALTIGLSKKSFEQIRRRIKKFKREILNISSKDNEKTKIYQINIQCFPFTKDDLFLKKTMK